MEHRVRAYIKDTIVATPIGENTEETFNAMLNGKSCLKHGDVPCISVFQPKSKWYGLNTSNTIIKMAKEIAAKNSIEYSNKSVLLIISTTKGDIEELEKGEYILAGMQDTVGNALNCTNKPIIISNACISGVSATILAKRYIENGLYKHIVVAGCDRFSQFVYTGFDSFKSLSLEPCRPYDSSRCGLNLGEGGACLLISTDGSVEIKGGSITNDANHISGPSRSGDGLFYAIEEAMNEAYGKIDHPVTFANAHGTSTIYNDEMEGKALALAGMTANENAGIPQGIPINSLKGYIGHTLGASGVIEIAMCAKQLENHIILGTKGFNNLGVTTPLNVVKSPLDMKIYGAKPAKGDFNCIKTASGFGGCNAAVVLELFNKEHIVQNIETKQYLPVKYKCRKCSISAGKIKVDGNTIFESTQDFAPFIREAYKTFCLPNIKFYKIDNMCKLGYVAAEILLEGASKENGTALLAENRDIAIVMANDVSSLDSDLKHQKSISDNNQASPAIFVYTLPNLVLGEICIRHKIKGENTFFISHKFDLTDYIELLLHKKGVKKIIYGWCSYYNNVYCANFGLIEKE